MPLETGTYISDLNSSNPAASDGLSQADDHLRLIKALVKATFPNVTGAVTATQAELNQLHTGTRTLGLANGSLGTPSLYFDSDTDLGLYRLAANQLGIAGRLLGNGAKDPGELCMFPFVPSTMATGGTAAGTERYVECDGSTYTNVTFPDLATALGQGGSSFVTPDMKTTGRFPRSRTASVAVGTTQSNTVKTHTHSVTGTAASNGDHVHGVTDPGHNHSIPDRAVVSGTSQSGGGSNSVTADNSASGSNTTGISINTNGTHTHTVSGTAAAAADAGTETRPEALAVVMCLKT